MNTPRLLLVDDEPHVLSALRRALRRGTADGLWSALHIDAFTDPVVALAHADEHAYDLAISDFRMPTMNGAQFLARLRERQPDCRRMMLSAYADFDALADAINSARIAQFLSKPWNEPELLAAVHEQLEEHRRSLDTALMAERQRLVLGELTPQEAECRRLERLEPGLTRVQWSEDGAYVLEPLGAEGH
ncbi:response regulator [Roseateles cellulosilyticus]|uniref:Response regulator n=1 Tax=Pelomonas cellulosilytica TaxID=2906762 RepID=A0ABS8XMJ7_9BURK|nr:response regulator [Pelomonas sp. P8]MCE4554004.1 response regulator [Pelomonas sp. P8]